MKGAKLSAKFWRGSKDDFTFKKFGDPRTREPPVGLIKMNKEATEEDIDLVTVGNDGQAEVDIPLQIAS